MLKYLVKKGYVDTSKMLLDLYTKLDLTPNEMMILLHLVEQAKNNTTLSVNQIKNKFNLSSDVISSALNALLNKGLIVIDIEYTKSNKAKEVYNIDELMNLIEKLILNDIKETTINNNQSLVKELIDVVETSLNKPLTPYEIDIILLWEQNGVSVNYLKKCIDIALSKKIYNLKYIDKIVLSNNSHVELNEVDSKVIDDIFRNIK